MLKDRISGVNKTNNKPMRDEQSIVLVPDHIETRFLEQHLSLHLWRALHEESRLIQSPRTVAFHCAILKSIIMQSYRFNIDDFTFYVINDCIDFKGIYYFLYI